MGPYELMRKLVDALEAHQIRYFVTGSVATLTYGEARFTLDVDVVIELAADQVDVLCSTFAGPDYYCSRDALVQAVQQHFQCNVIDTKTGFKIDVIIPEDNDFNRSRFARRRRLLANDGREAWFASPEDVILKKLEYYQEGRAEKHIRDIVGVLNVQGDKLDRVYIEEWAQRLGLSDTWKEILIRAAE